MMCSPNAGPIIARISTVLAPRLAQHPTDPSRNSITPDTWLQVKDMQSQGFQSLHEQIPMIGYAIYRYIKLLQLLYKRLNQSRQLWIALYWTLQYKAWRQVIFHSYRRTLTLLSTVTLPWLLIATLDVSLPVFVQLSLVSTTNFKQQLITTE
jgi:hypothetical protein